MNDTGHSRAGASRSPIAILARCFRAAAPAAVVALLLGGAAGGDGADSTSIDASIQAPAPGPAETLPAGENPFREGEYLKFSVRYGFVSAGSAYLEVPKSEEINGKTALVLQARAESNAFF